MCADWLKTSILFVLVVPFTFSPPVYSDDGGVLAKEFCQACHLFKETDQAGTLGPPLMAMKGRFPDRKRLFNIIDDPAKAIHVDTMMPPFGRNKLLDKDQINSLIDFLYTL